MIAWRFATRNFLRGLRAGRLSVLMIALTVAVAAITSVGFFIDRVRASVAQEAAGMLAADLRLNGSDPLNADYLAEAERRGLKDRAVHVVPDGGHRGRREPARKPLRRERCVIRCAAKCGSPTPSAGKATPWPARRPRAVCGSRKGSSRA